MHFPQPKNWLAAPFVAPTAGAFAAGLSAAIITGHCLRHASSPVALSTSLIVALIPLHIAAPAVFLYKLSPAMLRLGLAQTLQLFPPQPLGQSLARRLARHSLTMIPLSFAITVCVLGIMALLGLKPASQEIIKMLASAQADAPFFILAFFATAFLAPVTEEILFRLGLANCLQCYLPHQAASALTALVFAAMHGQWQTVPTLFFIGLYLQKAKEQGGLLQSICLHAIYNTFQMACVFLALKLLASFPAKA